MRFKYTFNHFKILFFVPFDNLKVRQTGQEATGRGKQIKAVKVVHWGGDWEMQDKLIHR